MRSTIVPAQITTVEDKIVGNLSLTQMALLVAPVIFMAVSFAALPPFSSVASYKLAMGATLFGFSAVLAIRIKGELLLSRITTRLLYNLRPKFYTYDKNDAFLRNEPKPQAETESEAAVIPAAVESFVQSVVDTPIRARLEQAIADPRSNFHISVRKGGLSVNIHEIKEESI